MIISNINEMNGFEMYESIIEEMADGIMIEDQRGYVIFANNALVEILGYKSKEEVCKRPWIDFFSLEEEQTIPGKKEAHESLLLTVDGKKIPVLVTSCSFYLKEEYVGVLSVIKNITKQKEIESKLEEYRNDLEAMVEKRTEQLLRTTETLKEEIIERKAAEEKIRYLANHDYLTNLPNRHFFFNRLQEELLKAKETGNYLALLYIDLDGFKAINDELGHEIGDIVLKETSSRISECLDDADMVSRFGGDEFTVILPCTDENRPLEIANKIVGKVSNPFHFDGEIYNISASIGISIYPKHARLPKVLLSQSDKAMYVVKNSGKNNFLLYHPRLKQKPGA